MIIRCFFSVPSVTCLTALKLYARMKPLTDFLRLGRMPVFGECATVNKTKECKVKPCQVLSSVLAE